MELLSEQQLDRALNNQPLKELMEKIRKATKGLTEPAVVKFTELEMGELLQQGDVYTNGDPVQLLSGVFLHALKAGKTAQPMYTFTKHTGFSAIVVDEKKRFVALTSELKIQERIHPEFPNVTILDVQGLISLGYGSKILRNKIYNLAEAGKKKILLNLNGDKTIVYFDSSGVGELKISYTMLRQNKGDLKLLKPSQNLFNFLVATCYDEVIDIFTDERDALKSFA